MKTLLNSGSEIIITEPLELIDVVSSTNCFSANGWSYEVAKKYLFSFEGKIIEAGFYKHYADEKMSRFVKQVIELPTSYGCPMKCAYCASSHIDSFSSLTTELLCRITDILMDSNDIPNNDEILVTLTGTGDAFFTMGLISEYISGISQKYCNLCFTISSCNWTKGMLKIIEELSARYKFRNIQFTYISSDEVLVKRVIMGLQCIDYQPLDLIEHIANSPLCNWRINYLMLQSINDDDASFVEFAEMIKPIKDKVIVRISSLNETAASIVNGLKPSTIQRSRVLQNILKQNGVDAYLFFSEHNDNMNCGQLVLENSLRKWNKHANFCETDRRYSNTTLMI